jgi:hypothetical protein
MSLGLQAEAGAALRAHAGLAALVLAYLLVAFLVGGACGIANHISLWLYGTRFNVITLIFGAGFLVAYAAYVVTVLRPARPIETICRMLRSRYLTRRRLFNAVPAIVLLSAFTSVFTSLKAMIPLVHPYNWDATLAAWDRSLHFGTAPWRLLQPILGYPVITGMISVAYGFWLVVLGGCLFWQTFAERDRGLRTQFLVAYVVCFAVLGNFAATWLASGGPCFYGRLIAGPDPFAPLMLYLHWADQQIPLGWSFASQDMLWDSYVTGRLEPGSGISAMPSLHVGGATLCALLGWRADRRLGWALTAYAGVIMLGSVHLGWHYAIDGYAACLGTLAIWALTGAVVRRFAAADFPAERTQVA